MVFIVWAFRDAGMGFCVGGLLHSTLGIWVSVSSPAGLCLRTLGIETNCKNGGKKYGRCVRWCL